MGRDETEEEVRWQLATFAEADRGAIVERDPWSKLRSVRYEWETASQLAGVGGVGVSWTWPPTENPPADPVPVSHEIKTNRASLLFQRGDQIRHAKFGDGLVIRALESGKIEVLFADEARILVHGHG
jgi:hypothetical protein